MGYPRKQRKIKANKPGRGGREPLSRERIELAALDLIEHEGLEGFSTRKLGEALGCEAMSIYHHFPSKAHLLNALVDRLITGIAMPAGDVDPIERIRRISYSYRRIGHRHPRLFPYVALYRMNSRSALGFLDQVIGMFRDAGLSEESTARLFRALSYYLTGAVLDETSGYAKGPSAVEPVSDQEIARDFPLVAMAGPYFRQQHFEDTFATGLKVILQAVRDAAGRTRAGKREARKGNGAPTGDRHD